MIISTIGQFFCGGSGMTSASRMMYAFSRDRALPGHQLWSRVAANKAPRNATLGMATICLIVALPALYGNAARVPIAFYALASITVVGLYIAYVIPVFLRWRMGDSFQRGPWTLGEKYKWMCPLAIVEVIVVCIIAFLPTAPGGIPGNDAFHWNNGLINYCPIIVGVVALYAVISWFVSAKNWFKGPIRTVDLPAEMPASGD